MLFDIAARILPCPPRAASRFAPLLGYRYASRIITPIMLDDLPTYCLGVTKKSRCVVRHVSQDEPPASLPPSTSGPVHHLLCSVHNGWLTPSTMPGAAPVRSKRQTCLRSCVSPRTKTCRPQPAPCAGRTTDKMQDGPETRARTLAMRGPNEPTKQAFNETLHPAD